MSESWRNRNRCFHELVHSIRRNLATVSVAEDVEVIEAVVNPCSWSPLPQGVLIFNVDAAFNPASRVAVLVMVLQRSNGSVLACGILKKEFVPSALHAELLAIYWAWKSRRKLDSTMSL
ncbi:hypothetical protein CCACVL1_05958 [Corchorus capsularis]|uniref:Uncharacterized protein n=1 Tax=Corchorus capsularis TaxID=210143 RepID=A0A1R3JIA2_COCAP|nr:hypothetical protein CCACVL1_05958 [Corchorus capsularis]